MITTSMLKRQVSMADDDEFDHIVKHLQIVLRLKDQYKNHPYVEEFTKACNVMFVYGTYVLEGEADAKFSLDDIWNLFQGDALTNSASSFCRQMRNCMKAWNYLQKGSGLPLNTEIIKQTHKIMVEDEKDIIVGEDRKSPVFVGSHIFASASHVEGYMQFLGFMKLKKDDPIMAATSFFENIINIYPFQDGNGRICHLILAHVLLQLK